MCVRGLYIHMYTSKVVLPPHELLDNVIPSLPISLLPSPPPCVTHLSCTSESSQVAPVLIQPKSLLQDPLKK